MASKAAFLVANSRRSHPLLRNVRINNHSSSKTNTMDCKMKHYEFLKIYFPDEWEKRYPEEAKAERVKEIEEQVENLMKNALKPYVGKLYTKEIDKGNIRRDTGLSRLAFLFRDKKNILDYGSGPGGNVKFLSEKLKNKNFHLFDLSKSAIKFAQNEYLKNRDKRKNNFFYYYKASEIRKKFDVILLIEVLEHIPDYKKVLDTAWNLLKKDGVLLISIPVKGWRDTHREHINKFTIRSMFKILSEYSEWIHISPRTYSGRSGILSTAYFYLKKTDK